MQALAAETGLTITNPLVLYRALVATKQIQADPAQHRLALHLQKLYHRLKDYEPEIEYRHQLEQVTRTLGQHTLSESCESAAAPGRISGIWDSLRASRADRDSLALTRRLTSHEAALSLDSPQGLLLYGEVGTGKSMLIDLLADSLPNRKKRRYHFNAFMLDTFARIEQQRILRSRLSGNVQHEHTLLAMARDMISTSPILFLDEFQLPDRASSKIISNLFASFFQLGGVLVATSNRMPEELSKASGTEFAVPSSPTSRVGFSGLRSYLAGAGADDLRKGTNSRQSEFNQFLEVLKARCETWNMESKTDFRRREVRSRPAHATTPPLFDGKTRTQRDIESSASVEEETLSSEESKWPAYYFPSVAGLISTDALGDESVWQASILAAVPSQHLSVADVPWQRGVLDVFGRKVTVPKAFESTSMWTFEELCGSYLGPADYITLASTYSTLILDRVPVLSAVQKNEARRFITLLDALYESRCRLLVRAEAGPDDLFFPEQRRGSAGATKGATDVAPERDMSDGVYAETLSEIYQDQTSPFRPNVSAYGSGEHLESTLRPLPEAHPATRSILADEDADFGPVYGAGRSAGASSYDERHPFVPSQTGPDFQKTDRFTGQDERFAYKRAESRLWELCSRGWWDRVEQGNWWKPLDKASRAWEKTGNEDESTMLGELTSHELHPSGKNAGTDDQSDVFRHGASPFRRHEEPPPKLAWTHVWGMMSWGRKAGTWGRGTDGVEVRLQEKAQERDMLRQVQAKPRKNDK